MPPARSPAWCATPPISMHYCRNLSSKVRDEQPVGKEAHGRGPGTVEPGGALGEAAEGPQVGGGRGTKFSGGGKNAERCRHCRAGGTGCRTAEAAAYDACARPADAG